jgi:hypothetical protein
MAFSLIPGVDVAHCDPNQKILHQINIAHWQVSDTIRRRLRNDAAKIARFSSKSPDYGTIIGTFHDNFCKRKNCIVRL